MPANGSYALCRPSPSIARCKDVVRCVWQERHVARSLDRSGQHTLVLGASACLATRTDFATIGDVLFQAIDLLVRYYGSLVPGAPG